MRRSGMTCRFIWKSCLTLVFLCWKGRTVSRLWGDQIVTVILNKYQTLIWIRKRRLVCCCGVISRPTWYGLSLIQCDWRWRQLLWMIKSCSWSLPGKHHWNYQALLWRPSKPISLFLARVLGLLKSWSPFIQMPRHHGDLLLCTVFWGAADFPDEPHDN